MKSIFINNSLFRIITPAIYGVIVYVLILLFFDSIKQLSENFFSFEVMLCIIITYSVFELMRLITNLLEKRFENIQNFYTRITLQILINSSAVFIVTSLILVLYYRYLVGFTNFSTELLVFNTIYIFTCFFYNILYFSIVYLNRTNEVKLNHENVLRQSIESELEEYKSRINPDLLYSSLENLIALVRKDTSKASEFIQNLSDVYRYIVSSKRNEPIEIRKEFEIAEKLIFILNAKYQNSIKLEPEDKILNSDKKIIPGTLHIVVEELIHNNLVSELQPLSLKYRIIEDLLVIECKTIKRLISVKSEFDEFENLKKAYLTYSDKSITMKVDDSLTYISIPLI